MTDNHAIGRTTRPESQQDAKKTLRATLRAARRERRENGHPARYEDWARTIEEVALSLPQIQAARCIASYESTPLEPPTDVLNKSLAKSARLLVPITLPDLTLDWRELGSDIALGKNAIAEADVILTPGLAISPDGDRLGQGGGCYDKTLPNKRPGAPVITIVFDSELDQNVPTDAHDQRIDAAITECRVRIFSPRLTPPHRGWGCRTNTVRTSDPS